MLKKIQRFKRLATLRKRDVSKEIANSNFIENEIIKNKNLITQIDTIMDNGRAEKSDKIISSGYFKNNAQLLNTLQSQKNIADNRNKHLLNEKKNIQQKIIINNLKKNQAEDKTTEYKKQYRNELEKRNSP